MPETATAYLRMRNVLSFAFENYRGSCIRAERIRIPRRKFVFKNFALPGIFVCYDRTVTGKMRKKVGRTASGSKDTRRMVMEKWMVYMKKADFSAISSQFGIDPVTARILRNREVIGDEAIRRYLRGGMEDLYDPLLMKDMAKAADILLTKIKEQKKIRVIGDYDIDGIMSSYILKRGLSELGADVDLRIPDRIRDGYGINIRLVEEAHSDGIDTIVTCDNGIAAVEQMKLAHKLGMTTVITDHHEVREIPEADAVVNPHQADDAYPYKNLCGASVAWKLIKAMGGDAGDDLLQYAAFATVGDVVDLTDENRILVREGIRRLRRTTNPGILALAKCTGMELENLNSYHIGFVLGPCFNASGRLDTAMLAEKMLEAKSESEAAPIAAELHALNERRKEMTERGVEQAEEYLSSDGREKDPVYVIYLPDIHESIAGIIAGRIREKYYHPVFVLTKGEKGVKGSGRSIPEYSMFQEMQKADALLDKFGGHPMAAGLSLQEENIDAFRSCMNENCTLTKEDLFPKIHIDVPMPVSYVTEHLIEELEILEPFGKENEKPIFAQKELELERPMLIGKNKNVLKAKVKGMPMLDGLPLDLVCFRNAPELYERLRENPVLTFTYYPDINIFRDRKSLQIVISHFQ